MAGVQASHLMASQDMTDIQARWNAYKQTGDNTGILSSYVDNLNLATSNML